MSTLGFFAIILAVYYILPHKFRWGLLLLASVVFYASADWKMLALIGGSIVVSYIAGLKIEQAENKKQKKNWMAGCIILLVVILMLFKYFGFFADAVGQMLGAASFVFQLAMPLGISYYTFKIISYLADIYQDLKDFIGVFQLGMNTSMNDALCVCKEHFAEFWGQRLVNTMRALHDVKYNATDEADQEYDYQG